MMEPRQTSRYATILGLASILFWSTTIAISRSLTEKLGTLNTAFFLFSGSGGLLFILFWLKTGRSVWASVRTFRWNYFLRVGLFFILYMVLLYVAVGEASGRKETVVIGIINYLWPALTFMVAVFLLKEKARRLVLAAGLLLACSGIVMALGQMVPLRVNDIVDLIVRRPLPYTMVFLAAFFWAAYSNLTRRHTVSSPGMYLSFFFLTAAGLVFLIMMLTGEWPTFSPLRPRLLEFLYLLLFPSSLAYLFWDSAMKDGDKNLVVAVSFAIPLLSTALTGLYLHISIGVGFWVAVLFIVVGALLCRKSMG